MKRVFTAFLSLILILAFAGCSNDSVQENTSAISSDTSKSSSSEESGLSSDEVSGEETNSAESNILIVYFSWSGNTEKIANMIHDAVGGDMFEITPETPYTDDYDDVVAQAREEQQQNLRPSLATHVDNWSDYDTVFIGYPNWWSDLPMPVFTFLEEYDFSDKTVIPFCTHGGGGFGRGVDSIQSNAEGAAFLDGLQVRDSMVDSAESDVSEWLSEIGVVS